METVVVNAPSEPTSRSLACPTVPIWEVDCGIQLRLRPSKQTNTQASLRSQWSQKQQPFAATLSTTRISSCNRFPAVPRAFRSRNHSLPGASFIRVRPRSHIPVPTLPAPVSVAGRFKHHASVGSVHSRPESSGQHRHWRDCHALRDPQTSVK